ncbi:MAG: hypothetical protein ACKV2U_20290 [Bryobacteraceae bacterium]
MPLLSRRTFLAALASPAPVRQITKGPRFHWFGYYDKLQFDPAGRYVLSNQVNFESRSPLASDTIRVGMVDTADNDRWIELGTSSAWNWQQGCMLQWVPGSKTDVLWNDRVDGQFVCHLLNVQTRKKRTIPSPIYTLSPDGKWAITCDFRRLNDVRPGYGYAGVPDPNASNPIPDDAGIWRVDVTSGKRELLISVADAARIPYPAGYSNGAKHWFNHLLISPDGGRFIFLHRWRGDKEGRGFSTRLFTADARGKDLYVTDPHGKTSHFVWRDPKHILAWAWHPSMGDKFYLYTDKTEKVEAVGPDVMTVNGHCTYLNRDGGRWILNDAYPDKERNQNVFLYDTASGRRLPLGSFYSPPEYTGEWRCDTHPRSSTDGTKVVIDSPHNGGRQMYLIDVAGLVRG